MTPLPPPPATAAPPLQAHPSLSWLWTTTAHSRSKRKHERARQPSPSTSSRTAREKRRNDKKCQRLLRKADTRDRVARVFQTEGIPQHLLLLLDVGSVEAFVVFLGEFGASATAGHAAVAAQSRWIFRDEVLWSRMLSTHFKIPSTVNNPALESNSSSTIERTRCKTHQSQNLSMDALLKNVGGGGCASLAQFLAWSQEREWFDQHVEIIMGDGAVKPRIPEVDLCDVLTAAEEIRIRKRGLTMMTTTQVRCLVHVIDTRMALQSPWGALSRNFDDAMRVMQRESQKNIAVVVPSFGTLDHQQRQLEPSSVIGDIATMGLREIQRFAIQSDWNGQIGIVCYDKQHFRDFQAQKQKLLDAFGSIF